MFGIDGMDWQLCSRYMAEGRMPNLAALARRGGFLRLRTSTPPQSPVAWSDFITGTRSERHGIYDFVHRDLPSMLPTLSTSQTKPASWVLKIRGWQLPLAGAEMKLLRRGRPFWDTLSDSGVPSTILKVPAHYPPTAGANVRVISGMGTPDLLGTYGVFQLYTDDETWRGKAPAGGRVHMIDFAGGQTAHATLEGPPNPFRTKGEEMGARLEITADAVHDVALVGLGGEERILLPGEWSDWIPVSFDPGPMLPAVNGMVRIRVNSVTPRFSLYVSPINIDPTDPAQPISAPESYASEVAADIGRYGTLGIPEESKALESGVFTDADYLAHASEILQERIRLMTAALARFRGGFFYIYFGTIDQVSHSFWRTLPPGAPSELESEAQVIPDRYAQIDRILGEAMQRLPAGTDVIVMSDHGFSPWLTKVNLNTWLRERGYLALIPGRRDGNIEHIEWSQTKAYSIGINALFLNLEGREPNGVVRPGEREALLDGMEIKLRAWRDPRNGEPVVTDVERPRASEHGERTPDLIVGYNRLYRASESSAIGGTEPDELYPNRDKWSGDHCMDPAQVPGVLVTSFALNRSEASLVDLAPTILSYFGVDKPTHYAGESLLR